MDTQWILSPPTGLPPQLCVVRNCFFEIYATFFPKDVYSPMITILRFALFRGPHNPVFLTIRKMKDPLTQFRPSPLFPALSKDLVRFPLFHILPPYSHSFLYFRQNTFIRAEVTFFPP